jgi:hypothetical protein
MQRAGWVLRGPAARTVRGSHPTAFSGVASFSLDSQPKLPGPCLLYPAPFLSAANEPTSHQRPICRRQGQSPEAVGPRSFDVRDRRTARTHQAHDWTVGLGCGAAESWRSATAPVRRGWIHAQRAGCRRANDAEDRPMTNSPKSILLPIFLRLKKAPTPIGLVLKPNPSDEDDGSGYRALRLSPSAMKGAE